MSCRCQKCMGPYFVGDTYTPTASTADWKTTLPHGFAPTEAQKRKKQPLATGCLAYFPDALSLVAEVSLAGSQQHHPGEPLHWEKGKSTDHADCLLRHLRDHLAGVPVDTDGQPHLAKVAWRALALLQTELEKGTGK